MTPEAVLADLRAAGDPAAAPGKAAYHKTDREVWGVPNPVLNDLAATLRRDLPAAQRVPLAEALWDSGIFEARILAAKALTQARLRPEAAEEDAWRAFRRWVPQFDGWAIADHACAAGAKRLVAHPARLDEVEEWTRSDHLWTRRAALVATLPWAKLRHPSDAQIAARERILGWAAGYVPDRAWFIQKAIAWWLRDLSKHDPDRTRAFLAAHGAAMKPFARREAARLLPAAPPGEVKDG